MKNMTLKAIADAVNGALIAKESDKQMEIDGVVIDSRKVEKNYVFIATVGERVDGHDYIAQVALAGAACVVCEKPPVDVLIPYILVKDSFEALKAMATYYLDQLSCKVVGITGSVGKTTTKEFIASTLEMKYHVLKTEGNFNNEVGLPLTVLRIRDDHEVAVLEMGINHFGEMDRLAAIARPDICVMTNIGQCHLEFLGDRAGILRAKSEMLPHMKKTGRLCVNGDDDMLATINEVHGKAPVRFGLEASNDIYATNIESKGLLGSTCQIHTGDYTFEVMVPQPGIHMIYNALAATAVGIQLGLSKHQIKAGIESVEAVRGRSNIIMKNGYCVIDDCYNANPVSMKAALDLLSLADTRKIAVLGDMGELGNDEITMHSKVGEQAAMEAIDILLCVGELSVHMASKAREEVQRLNKTMEIYSVKDRFEAIAFLQEKAQKKDTILIKASHFMGFEEIVKALLG